LAAGTHAALRSHGAIVVAFLPAQEHILERHHAGVGEQQRRIVGRYQAAGGYALMALALEIGDKALAQLVRGYHDLPGSPPTSGKQPAILTNRTHRRRCMPQSPPIAARMQSKSKPRRRKNCI